MAPRTFLSRETFRTRPGKVLGDPTALPDWATHPGPTRPSTCVVPLRLFAELTEDDGSVSAHRVEVGRL